MTKPDLMAFALVRRSKMHIEVGWRKEHGWKMTVAACGRTGTPLDFSHEPLGDVNLSRVCTQCLAWLSRWGVA